MKVLVIGAGGRTGRAVVDRARAAGHDVTAFVHHAEGYDVPGVAVREGDAADRAAVEAAVSGQDAVVDTIGGKTPYEEATGDVRVYDPDSGEKAHTITRGDLAAFLVAQLTGDEHVGRAVTIANPRGGPR